MVNSKTICIQLVQLSQSFIPHMVSQLNDKRFHKTSTMGEIQISKNKIAASLLVELIQYISTKILN